MRNLIFFLLFNSSLQAFSAIYLKVLYIADHTIPCGSKKCLLTRDAPTDTFQIFDKNIEGFSYQAGFEYCILLEIQTPGISEPPIVDDSSQIKYVLHEIKSKIKTNISAAPVKKSVAIPDSSKWILYKLKTKDGTRTFSISKANIEFDIKNNIISGNTDCNSFTASYLDDTTFKIENIITTKMSCKKLSIEKEFINMLNLTNKYKAASNLLYLYNNKKLLAIFNKKK